MADKLHDSEEKRIWQTWHVEERSVEEQIASLTPDQLEAFKALKTKWQNKENKPIEFDDFMLLRFIRNSPGKHKFNVDSAFKVLENYEKWSLSWGGLHSLKISDVRAQLEKCQISLLPDTIRTKEGYQILYVRIANHVPGTDSIKALIKSMAYLLERVTEREKSCTEGIVFLQDFAGVGWKHFSLSDLSAIGQTLQGKFPFRIRSVVMVNTPFIFSAAYALARHLMTKDLQDKIHVFSDTEEVTDLIAGETHEERLACLPIELGGDLDVEQSSEDYIRYRYIVEGLDYEASYPSIEEIDSELSSNN